MNVTLFQSVSLYSVTEITQYNVMALNSRAHSLSLSRSDVTCRQAQILGKHDPDKAGFRPRRLLLKTQTFSKIMSCIHLMTDTEHQPPHLRHSNAVNCYVFEPAAAVRDGKCFSALLSSRRAVSPRYTSCFQSAQRDHTDP